MSFDKVNRRKSQQAPARLIDGNFCADSSHNKTRRPGDMPLAYPCLAVPSLALPYLAIPRQT